MKKIILFIMILSMSSICMAQEVVEHNLNLRKKQFKEIMDRLHPGELTRELDSRKKLKKRLKEDMDKEYQKISEKIKDLEKSIEVNMRKYESTYNAVTSEAKTIEYNIAP